ncbi:MAG: recombinase [Kiritimatiellae bacterium]|nr:recombinase [Kiritimatiellia bacterium]MDD4024887.1 recombinase [Kiritimatiellia bacterium]MDD4621832.1 recombinase [Kiritimatiellia bacterium]
MSIESLQNYVFTSKYSRYIPEKLRRETFDEAVERVIDMHRRHFAAKGLDIEDLLSVCEGAIKRRMVLGSQRAMQFGGDPILRKNARIYNCTTSYCDRPRFFQEALWLLLCGCGVGFSVQRHHIDKLPGISKPGISSATFVIPDTIEGWADALGALLSTYFDEDRPFPEFAGQTVQFDYSQIRSKGRPISSGMGRAPGPEPLRRSLEKIRGLLDQRVAEGHTRMRSVDAYDILMHASDAVLSGGVRRSATICLFSPDDELMATAKTGNWFTENPQRARSNNSAVLLRDQSTREQFAKLMKSVREFGEPGFVWTDHPDMTFNPCGEIGLYPQIEGKTGFAFCNLCEINMRVVDNAGKFREACKAAAILGTLQADYTDFGYLGETSTRIAKREALLGISMTGMMEHPAVAFDPDLQREMARLILEVNAEIAARIGINPCARATCVKPAGTTSSILGTSSGIHPHHAKRYFRRAQANEDELLVDFFKAQNPMAVEKSVWNPNGTDVVLTFCVEASPDSLTKRDVDAVELLRKVKLTKENWIDAGKRAELCARPWLSHNVSNTISVKDGEWEHVEAFIFEHRHAFAGVSLLPDGGDLDYPQAPFCEVLTAAEIVDTYGVGALLASGLIVDGLHAFDDNLWAACDCALGRGENLDEETSKTYPKRVFEAIEIVREAKLDWVRRARKFARNYFSDDILKMTRCLKRVNACKQWEDLTRTYLPVDYTKLIERQDNTTVTQTVACAGGKCELI